MSTTSIAYKHGINQLSPAPSGDGGSFVNDNFLTIADLFDAVLPLSGGTMTGTLNVNQQSIHDGSNVIYDNGVFSGVSILVSGYSGGTFTGDITLNTHNIITDTSTGTKIGTATNQKVGFWSATPVVQQTTGVGSSTFTANSGTAVNSASTFDGYTLAQIVKALRTVGILA